MVEKDGFFVPVTDTDELAEKRQFCHNRVPGWELDADGRIKLDANGDSVWGTRPCGTPLFEFNGARRHSISEYITKHAKGAFKLLIADEVHQFKSKSSDRGVAFHQLVTSAEVDADPHRHVLWWEKHLNLLAAAPLEPWCPA